MTWPLRSVLPMPVGCWAYRAAATIVPDRLRSLLHLSHRNDRLQHGRSMSQSICAPGAPCTAFSQQQIKCVNDVINCAAQPDPRFTSKSNSQCGRVFEHLTLADRWVVCDCGLSLDRDHNVAINIRNRAGHARWGLIPNPDNHLQHQHIMATEIQTLDWANER
jgi:hypothetical protein